MTIGELFTALGLLTGGLVFWWAARAKGLATEGMGLIVLFGLVGGAIGAKLTQLAFGGLPTGATWTAALDPRSGGRALLGGVVFGWLAVEVAKRRLGIRRPTGDLFALALPAGEAIGRIGCFFNGCCFGTKCELPWAVEQHGALRHPAQLYSAVVSALLFGVLLWARPRLGREGDLFKLYLVGFGTTRFVLEFFRQQGSLLLGLSPMQWFCLELIGFVVFSLAVRKGKAATGAST